MKKKSTATLNGSLAKQRLSVMGLALTRRVDGFAFGVRVVPSASRTAFQGLYGDRLKVSVCAPPENNKANEALLEALSRWLDLPKAVFSVIAGHASRDKIILVCGVEEDAFHSRLAALQKLELAAKD